MSTVPLASDHPLFREGSLYRRATQDWLWFDGGASAMIRFFEGLRREELRREWIDPVLPKLQDWGHTDKVNQALHESLLERHRNAPREPRQKPQRATLNKYGRGGGRERVSCPLLRFDFEKDDPRVSTIAESVPGVFETHDSDAPKFEVDVPVERPDRSCLLLLFSQQLIEELRWLIAQPKERFPSLGEVPPKEWVDASSHVVDDLDLDDREVSTVLKRVFTDGMREETDETPENLPQFRRAWWISMRLAQAVGIAGVSNRSSMGTRLTTSVTLHRGSPNLKDASDHYWAVLCLGSPNSAPSKE